MILDTSFVIDLMKGEKKALNKLEELKENEVSVRITSLTGYELYLGVKNLDKPEKEKDKIEAFMDKVLGERVPYRWDHGKKSAEIQSKLKDQGEMIDLPDILIASVAAETGEKILTRNGKHFEKVEGIEVESY
ncbi:MAG: PIN domain-containing protein [Candidatus Nanohalobium sp.]